MGSCLGHCHLARESFSLYKYYSKAKDNVEIHIGGLTNAESEEHIINESPSSHCIDELHDHKFDFESKNSGFKRLKSVFSNIRNKYHKNSLRLELLDDEWSITEGDCSARTETGIIPPSAKPKGEKGRNSASVNSLDLEWENLPEMAVFSSNVEKEEPKSAASAGGWSRISSADSLEWDSAEVEMKEEVDTETEQLLHEIEMLSSKTLKETQEWATDS